jgi:oligopeptidase A
MEEILSLRQEMAQLLGFNNFAEYSLPAKWHLMLKLFINS